VAYIDKEGIMEDFFKKEHRDFNFGTSNQPEEKKRKFKKERTLSNI
jgi:hypothetical protein